jgi:hypothetical protein
MDRDRGSVSHNRRAHVLCKHVTASLIKQLEGLSCCVTTTDLAASLLHGGILAAARTMYDAITPICLSHRAETSRDDGRLTVTY